MGIAKLTDPESALINQIGPFSVYALLGGFFGSMVVEMIYYSSNDGSVWRCRSRGLCRQLHKYVSLDFRIARLEADRVYSKAARLCPSI